MSQHYRTEDYSMLRFRPEAPEPITQDRIRRVGILRQDIGAVVPAISLARLKPVELKSGVRGK